MRASRCGAGVLSRAIWVYRQSSRSPNLYPSRRKYECVSLALHTHTSTSATSPRKGATHDASGDEATANDDAALAALADERGWMGSPSG